MRFPDDVPVLTDGTVTLRPHRSSDLDGIVEQCTDTDSVAWTMVPTPYGRAHAVEWTESVVPGGWHDGTDLHLAVEVGGRFAGSVGLRPQPHGPADIAYGLHPAARGRGVATAAVGLLLDWAFDRGHTVVTWNAMVGNWASRRVAWAAGFHFGPTIPRLLRQRDRTVDAWTGWIGADDTRTPKSDWVEVPVLHTDGLTLRPWREEDGPRLVDASHDPLLRRWIPHTPLPLTLDHVPTYLRRVETMAVEGVRVSWCVADRDTDEALGNVALFEFEGDGSAQVGYWAHPAARGRGVLGRATTAVADWALSPKPEGFGLRRLYLLTATDNAPSRAVAERAGFAHVGTERASAVLGEDYVDNALYDRLAETG